jgi:hypothetical protein
MFFLTDKVEFFLKLRLKMCHAEIFFPDFSTICYASFPAHIITGQIFSIKFPHIQALLARLVSR